MPRPRIAYYVAAKVLADLRTRTGRTYSAIIKGLLLAVSMPGTDLFERLRKYGHWTDTT